MKLVPILAAGGRISTRDFSPSKKDKPPKNKGYVFTVPAKGYFLGDSTYS